MMNTNYAPIPRDWSVKLDAAEDYPMYEMDLSNMLSGANASYLIGLLADHALFNPALLGAFAPSWILPAGGYPALTAAQKSTYGTEKADYDRRLKIVTDLRMIHAQKSGSCTCYVEKMFKPKCILRCALQPTIL
jgi:hypothetical protein